MSSMSQDFRDAMRALPTGVTVVTTRGVDGSPLATTVNAVTSVSLSPPLLLVCLAHDSDTLAGIRESGSFAVNVLHEDQAAISARLAGKGREGKLAGIELQEAAAGIPRLPETLSWIGCRLYRMVNGGDHEIVIGQVSALGQQDEGRAPLLFYRGGYHGVRDTNGTVTNGVSVPELPASGRPTTVPEDLPAVAIVGGGASGTLTALQLLRYAEAPLRIALIERRDRLGRGPAYDTARPIHRLNVTADQMGAYPDDPGHFLTWARRREPTAGPHDFLPRSLFGDYLGEMLDQGERDAPPGVVLERIHDEAVGLAVTHEGREPTADLRLASGRTVSAERVVLAIGNLLPAAPPGAEPGLLEHDRYVADPWDMHALTAALADDSVLILGTGLTMVDVALTLGNTGGPVMHAVSRHGLLPKVHRSVEDRRRGAEPFPLTPEPFALDDLVPAVLARVAAVEQDGGDWREVVDALRPHVADIWRGLSDSDRKRFVTRLSRVWEVHRHRLAPEVASALERLRTVGRLRVGAAQVERVVAVEGGVDVRLRRLGQHEAELLRVSRVINCTGPAVDLDSWTDPLLREIIAAGHARPGPLRVGLDADESGRILAREGSPSRVLFTLGPPRRGTDWESTAIPEIRGQACHLARNLAAELAMAYGERSELAVAG